MQTITLHYESGIIPALVIASIFALKYIGLLLKKLESLGKLKKVFSRAILIVVVCFLLLNAFKTDYFYGPLPLTPSCWCLVYRETPDDEAFEKVLETIPEDASISASSEVRPHLTHRENAYNLPKITPDTDYIAIIDESRTSAGFSPHNFELSLISDPSFNQKYQLISHIGHYYLYQKNNSSANSQKTTLD